SEAAGRRISHPAACKPRFFAFAPLRLRMTSLIFSAMKHSRYRFPLVKGELTKIAAVEFLYPLHICCRQGFPTGRSVVFGLFDRANPRDHGRDCRVAEDKTQRRLGEVRNLPFHEELQLFYRSIRLSKRLIGENPPAPVPLGKLSRAFKPAREHPPF